MIVKGRQLVPDLMTLHHQPMFEMHEGAIGSRMALTP
jgi:hypothetical protein